MKYKLFDVVKTEDGHTATIIEILDNNKYKIRITDEVDSDKKIKIIREKEVESIIFKK